MATLHLTAAKQELFTLDKKLKLQPVTQPQVSLAYRTLTLVHAKLLTKFEDIEQNQVVMEDFLLDMWNTAGESDT